MPEEGVSASGVIRVHQHGPIRASSLRLADEAEDALVFEGRVSGARVSILIGELHHLILIDQLPCGVSAIYGHRIVLDAHTYSKKHLNITM